MRKIVLASFINKNHLIRVRMKVLLKGKESRFCSVDGWIVLVVSVQARVLRYFQFRF